jgi:hypothetical protein
MDVMKPEMRFHGPLMSGFVGLLVVTLAGFAALTGRAMASAGGQEGLGGLPRQAIQLAAYSRLPLSFAQNRGQAPTGVDYVADGPGWSLRLGRNGVRLALGGRHSESLLRVLAPDGRLRPPVAERRLPGRVNYFAGTDRARWVTGAPTFEEVVYRDVWPGINLAFHGHSGTLEFDLDLAPGADPSQVVLRLAGAHAVRADGRGGAVISGPAGTVRLAAPHALQAGRAVLSRLVITGDSIRLALGAYDRNRPLVVDPSLVYLTSLGGGYAAASGIAVDASGSAYVTGNTGTQGQNGRAFVTKLSPTGRVVYSSYLGGTSAVKNLGIAVDAQGDAYVTGGASASTFPTTPGAYQTSFGGGSSDAFVAKLNTVGGLAYATYLGGSAADVGNGIAVDATGSAYIAGDTGSSNFPTSPGAYQRSAGGGFVAKLNPAGSALTYSTYLNGSDVRAIAVDSSGDAYVTGDASGTFPATPGAYQTRLRGGNFDAFVVKLDAAGSGLVYSTCLGGNADEVGAGITVDSAGDAFVSGWTTSTDFPTTRGAYQTRYAGAGDDAFVTKLSPTGSGLLYSTYLGGRGGNSAGGIAVDSAGDAYVGGETTSSHFPTTPGAYQTSNKAVGGQSNAFVTKLNPTGSALLYSTYLPQDIGARIAVDTKGDASVADVSSSEAWAVKMALGADVVWGLRILPHTFTIRYQLSAPARLTVRIYRMLPGSLLKHRCLTPTRKNRRGGQCTRLVLVRGSLTLHGHPGANSFTFKGRIGGRKLGRGRYQLAATPAANGETGAPVTAILVVAR